MQFSEEGKRLKTLQETLKAVSAVYSLASEGKGINTVTLLNSPKLYLNVGPGNIKSLMKELSFEGLTNIGTKLREKVLIPYARDDMPRPLLVIVITDGQVRHLTLLLARRYWIAANYHVPGQWRDPWATQACN